MAVPPSGGLTRIPCAVGPVAYLGKTPGGEGGGGKFLSAITTCTADPAASFRMIVAPQTCIRDPHR